jgi:hypothetical protein
MEQHAQDKPVPQSPAHPAAMHQPLDPREQPHEDDERTPQPPAAGSMQQRGATEREVTPIKPLAQAPADPANNERDAVEDDIEPQDELTPG